MRSASSGTLASISRAEARHQFGQTPDRRLVAVQLQRDEAAGKGVELPGARFGQHLQQRRAVDPVQKHAAAALDRDRATLVSHGQPGFGQRAQHGRLEGGQPVPLGPVQLEHLALAVGEDLGRATLGQQLHPSPARSVPQAGPQRGGRRGELHRSTAGMEAKSNASDSTGHPGRASSSGRGTRWTCRCGRPLPRLNQFIFAGRYSSSTAPATRATSDQNPAASSAVSSVGSATCRPFQMT